MNFLKQNWFKISIIIILAIGLFMAPKLLINTNHAKMGDVLRLGDYEIRLNGLIVEDGERAHEDRLNYFKDSRLSTFNSSANYYSDTYKIVVPHISIKNLSQADTLRFDPKDFYLVTKSGLKYGHIQHGGDYEGGTLVGGEIKPGYVVSGWYGLNLPKGYNEGDEIFVEIRLPDINEAIKYQISTY